MNAILLHHPLHFPGARSSILTDAREVLTGLAAALRDDVLAAHRRVVRAFEHPAVSTFTWIILAVAVVGLHAEWAQARFAR